MARKDSDHQKKSMSALFRGREICKPFTRHYTDPEALYDGYIEDDDAEVKARTVRLAKKKEDPSGGIR